MTSRLFSDRELLRYSRHLMLPSVDLAGQQALVQARVLVVGLGGLGSAASQYLAASGVGHLFLADQDQVEWSNLQRQVIHREANLGQSKVASALQNLSALNSDVQLTGIDSMLNDDNLSDYVDQVDLVLDCCDNFATRIAVNRACYKAHKPLVSGAAMAMEGQLTSFDFRLPHSPCYQCLYDDLDDQSLTCSQSGVLSPLVGVVGSLQALEAVKLLVGIRPNLMGRLQLFDATTGQWREFILKPNPQCPVCASPVSQANPG
jgi:molybdopterin-synthase adenylyltransferase